MSRTRGRTRENPRPVDVHTAQWELAEIGGYMYRHEGSPVELELRDLEHHCKAELWPAVQAHRAAFAVLEKHGVVDDFERWRHSPDRCACGWPTIERAQERAR